MAKLEKVWEAKDFDAISIRASRCQVAVQVTGEDRVRLEGDFDRRFQPSVGLDVAGRWLRLHRLTRGGDQKISLTLPRDKAWVLNIFSGHGDIKIEGIQARTHIFLGHGHLRVDGYQGQLAVSAGNADMQVKRFARAEMPPEPQSIPVQRRPPPEPWHRDWRSWHRDWRSWDEAEWEDWGLDFGEKIAGWALSMGRFFEQVALNPHDADLSLTDGQGDIQCERIDSRTCLVRLGQGDIRLKSGYLGNLEVITNHGDVECTSIMPEGEWQVKATHGDIHVSLPANASARLDAATRHGDIRSEIPVVRVARQGPETHHGQRMVGIIGSKTEGKVPGLRISAMSGDIDLRSGPAVHASPDNRTAPVGEDATTQLEVLQALSEGKITVEEADRRLRDLESRKEKYQ